MDQRGSKTLAFTLVKYGFDDIDIRQMHATAAIGVVPDKQVALVDVALIGGKELAHGVGKGAQMQRHRQAARDHPAMAIAQPC